MIHHVVGGAADEELDRPGPRRLASGVVGADGIEVVLPVCREAVRGQDDVERGADLDFARELIGLRAVDVADDLVATAPTAARARGGVRGRRVRRRRRSSPSRRPGGRADAPGRPMRARPARSATARGRCPRSRSSSIRVHVRPPRRRAPARRRSPGPPARRPGRTAGGTTTACRGRRPPRSPSDPGRASPSHPRRPCASCPSRGSPAACRSCRTAYPQRPRATWAGDVGTCDRIADRPGACEGSARLRDAQPAGAVSASSTVVGSESRSGSVQAQAAPWCRPTAPWRAASTRSGSPKISMKPTAAAWSKASPSS